MSKVFQLVANLFANMLVYKFFVIFSFLITYGYTTYAKPNNTSRKVYKVGQPIVKGLMYLNEKGEPEGFPFEILLALTKDENISIEWVKGSWAELFQKLKDGEIDILPGTQITEDRTEYLDFLQSSMFMLWSELYVQHDINFNGLSDLENKKIAIIKNDNNSEGFKNYINGFQINYQPVYFLSHNDAIEALNKKEIYAMPGPASIIMGNLYGGLNNSKLYFNPTDLNIAFTKGKNNELQNKLNNRLEIYKKNPYSPYNNLIKKYGLASYSHDNYILPLWLKLSLVLLIGFIIIGTGFIYLLRSQVDKKTSELRERQVILEKALNLGFMGIWTYDFITKKIHWTTDVYKIYQQDPSRILSSDEMIKLIHPDDRELAVKAISDGCLNKKGFSFECRILLPSGEIAYTKQSAIIEFDEKNHLVKAIGITQDITSYKRAQLELIEAKNKAEESDRLKSQFLNNMSHEIRTPMNGIVGFANLLDLPNLSTAKKEIYTDVIRTSSYKLMRIIDDIIDISVLNSKKIHANIESFNLNALFYELIAYYKKNALEKKLPIYANFYLEDESCFIYSDQDKINKILRYMLDNAFKFTTSGFVELGYQIQNSSLEIWIRDTGIGISSDYYKTIFNSFSQESKEISFTYGGLGLGLSIAKHYSTIINGKLSFKSAKGDGSTFYLTLPYIQAQSPILSNLPELKRQADQTDTTLNIIIAEDEDINYFYLETILKEINSVKIIRAKNGKEAVDICAALKNIHLILMDIKMPVMDGYTATQQIRKFNKEIPIIAQTAFSSQNDKEIAKDAGCNDFLTKPILSHQLVDIINKYCPTSIKS